MTAKCIDLSLLIDNSMYIFKDVIQNYYCQFGPLSTLGFNQ